MRIAPYALVSSLLLAAPVLAQTVAPSSPPTAPSPFKGPITTTKIGGGLYMLSAGSNAVVAVGDKQVILVDTLFNDPDKTVAAVRAITPLPVKYVVNSHSHRDHTAANAAFAGLGAVVISTPKAAERIALSSRNPRGGEEPPIAKAGWPTVTHDKPTTISIPGQSLRFIPVEVSHTDNDAMVFFPKANVLILGDLHHSHEYPVWDAQNGCACGSYEGNLRVYRQALALTNARTRIVAGHGGLTDKAEVQAYVVMLETVRDKVKALIAQGLTKEQVIVAKPLAGDRSVQPGGPDNADTFIGTLYTALTTGKGA